MFGFIESELTGTENLHEAGNPVLLEYKVKDLLSVIDQGSRGICCSVVCAEIQHHVNKYTKSGELKIDEIYNKRSNHNVEGMTPKEAFEIMKKEQYITDYAMITNPYSLKDSILVNGPALLALPVYSDNADFWNGNSYRGGHAVSAVGYIDLGILIKNSWGYEWNDGGYTLLPYSEFNKIIEAWCVIC